MTKVDELMNATPPKFLVFLVRLLLPRICREHVLGDLYERYRSPFGYAADAVGAVPAAIVGQIRRATPLPFLLLEGLLVYASFFAAALSLREVDGSPDLSRVFRITVIVMAGLLWRDAYKAQPTRSELKLIVTLERAGMKLTPYRLKLLTMLQLIGGVDLAIYFSAAVTWIWHLFVPTLHLFPAIMTTVLGVICSSILISILRIWIEIRREDHLHHVS